MFDSNLPTRIVDLMGMADQRSSFNDISETKLECPDFRLLHLAYRPDFLAGRETWLLQLAREIVRYDVI